MNQYENLSKEELIQLLLTRDKQIANAGTLLQEIKLDLVKSNTKFSQFFGKLPVGVELYDARGYLIDINQAALKIFGTSKEQILGKHLFSDPNYMGKLRQSSKEDFDCSLSYDFSKIQKSGYIRSEITEGSKLLHIKVLILNDDIIGKTGYLLILSDQTKLGNLVNDLFGFPEIDSSHTSRETFTNVNLKEICNHAYTEKCGDTNPDTRLLYNPDELPEISTLTDRHLLWEVVSHLLSNTIRFTRTGTITLSYRNEEGQIRISIVSHGTGIASPCRSDIFICIGKINAFCLETGNEFPVYRSAIEKLGGNIAFSLDSEYGFHITIPHLEVKTETPVQIPSQNGKQAESSGKTVLIAEDVQENYFLLQVLLKKYFRILHAVNGEEAVQLYDKQRPDLILMDIKMPVMDGFEATRRIRQLSSSVPIIALTAFAFEQEKEKARECRMDDYLVKPIDVTLLKKTLDKFLEK